MNRSFFVKLHFNSDSDFSFFLEAESIHARVSQPTEWSRRFQQTPRRLPRPSRNVESNRNETKTETVFQLFSLPTSQQSDELETNADEHKFSFYIDSSLVCFATASLCAWLEVWDVFFWILCEFDVYFYSDDFLKYYLPSKMFITISLSYQIWNVSSTKHFSGNQTSDHIRNASETIHQKFTVDEKL